MTNQPDPVCFTCGLEYDGQHLNRMRNGAVCPTCRDRLLDSLPAPLPRAPRQEAADEVLVHGRAANILRALPPGEPSDD